MKKFLVIGNPIEHSLSPELHNFWIKENKLNAYYDKLLMQKNDLNKIFLDLRNGVIEGFNVTIPFKEDIINYVDELSNDAKLTNSVNTIVKKDNTVIGHNTDIQGFELAIRYAKFDIKNKKILILGAGGVTPSIIVALNNLSVSEIIICNRTLKNAEKLKDKFENIKVIKCGEECSFDMVVNATSLGLKESDRIDFNFDKYNNKIFYDIIYNPRETNFLKEAKKRHCATQNGKMMFIYQAHLAFTLWHNIMPKINDSVLKLLDR